jgi:hypothetical protein
MPNTSNDMVRGLQQQRPSRNTTSGKLPSTTTINNHNQLTRINQVAETSSQSKRELALNYLQEARSQALCALKDLEEYTNSNLDVTLFSAEGDSLHQMFDCMVQGPYARVDLWSPGSRNNLPVPHWSRDAGGAGLTRTLDLPCGGDKLHGENLNVHLTSMSISNHLN